ncbi:UDP-glucose 4-epimerase GalE [Luteimonas aestuarii]|uniref:UDP-glucose 4-epimerase n=1 Tax=Luteimonas aestuarii TaxID=453837 RepID=A0A4R5U4I1_9GAMM|nr:UDP-glucose 4-epimerase GalE [Luteimonas aestuarii]TDK28493.1 UDP-glucose 4-epimerase GalE [Luteimonas aestuarii]
MRILVCGGTGYIGSHTCVVLAERGHDLLIADNFSNSSPRVLERLQAITGKTPAFERIDLRDRDATHGLLREGGFDAVVHFAALKAVGESCEKPLDYFDNNITGTIHLLQAMQAAGTKRLVFSSSATVYGDPDRVPVREDAPLRVTNPYGRTKLVMEELIADLCASDPAFHAAVLRYFNPVGAHPSGLIGEDPGGTPNNLMPYICQVAVGRRERLSVFGGDWPTVDGSGVRDYIHVMDLARAHADAIDTLQRERRGFTVNLGTGQGVSVLQLVQAFERASGKAVPYEIVARRAGDVAEVYADPSLAQSLLHWSAEHDVDAMCRDAWRWQSMNPQGFAS